MYKHENKGTGTITVVDSDGTHKTFFPKSVIMLKRKYEGNGIVCLGREKVEQVKDTKNVSSTNSTNVEQIRPTKIVEKKPIKKEEIKEDD